MHAHTDNFAASSLYCCAVLLPKGLGDMAPVPRSSVVERACIDRVRPMAAEDYDDSCRLLSRGGGGGRVSGR